VPASYRKSLGWVLLCSEGVAAAKSFPEAETDWEMLKLYRA